MLKQSTQKRIIWVVLTLFSAIAVAGNGLHSLPGLGHSCRSSHDFRSAHDCCHISHDLTAGQEHSARHECDIYAQVKSGSEDDCAICRFFLQAKSLPLSIALESNRVAVYGPIDAYHSVLLGPIYTAYESRGPPSWLYFA
jgi:hypothetical protein